MTGLRARWGSIPRWGRAALIVGAALAALWLARVPLLVAVASALDVGEEPRRADLIFVLGGGVEHRVPRAAELYHAGYASMILVPPVVDTRASALGLIPNETEIAVGLLASAGVPSANVAVLPSAEGRVSSTTAEGERLRAYVEERAVSRLLVVTSSYHTRRARWAMRRALGDLPVEVVMVGVPDPEFDETNWWRRETGMLRVLEEYLKFAHNWVYR